MNSKPTTQDLINTLAWLNEPTDLTCSIPTAAYTTLVELIESHPLYTSTLTYCEACKEEHPGRPHSRD